MSDTIDSLEAQIREMKRRVAALRKQEGPEAVTDSVAQDRNGREVRLSELFGTGSELILIHNMGRRCSYCTLWADGFNGLVRHLETRAAFVLCSADPAETAAAFASERGWSFRVVSGPGLNASLGFDDTPGSVNFGQSSGQDRADRQSVVRSR